MTMMKVYKVIALIALIQGCTPDYNRVKTNLMGSWYSHTSSGDKLVERCTTYHDNERQSLEIYVFSRSDKSASHHDDSDKVYSNNNYSFSAGYWYFGQGKRLQHIAGYQTTGDNRVIPEDGKQPRNYGYHIVKAIDERQLQLYKDLSIGNTDAKESIGALSVYERVDNCERFADVINSLPVAEKDLS
jgi:hypothetical protein